MDTWFIPFLSNLLVGVPLYLVQLVGVILAVIWWRRHPRVSLVLAVATAFLVTIVMGFLYAWLPNHLRELGWEAVRLGTVFSVLNLVRSVAIAGVWVLLLCAVFSGRAPVAIAPRPPQRERPALEPPVVSPVSPPPASPASQDIYRRDA
jgi:hypothetical protein